MFVAVGYWDVLPKLMGRITHGHKKRGGVILICTYLTHIIMVVAIDTLLLDVDGCYLYYAERSSHEAYWQ